MRHAPTDPGSPTAIARAGERIAPRRAAPPGDRATADGSGPLPLLPRRKPDPRLIVARADDGPAATAFRVLRYKLLHGGDPRVLLVSSARSGEGKTTCAVNLALAIAEQGAGHVLLVEASQRRPQLAHLFGFAEPEPRSSDFSQLPCAGGVRWWIVDLAPLGLHVASMTAARSPCPDVDGASFASMMSALRDSGFDYIIVDAPPVLDHVAVNLLQEAADGVLLVTRANRSRGRHLRAAVEQLAPDSVVGIVHLET